MALFATLIGVTTACTGQTSAIQCVSASEPEGVEERKLAARPASTTACTVAGVPAAQQAR
jgi:hypothetical protein